MGAGHPLRARLSLTGAWCGRLLPAASSGGAGRMGLVWGFSSLEGGLLLPAAPSGGDASGGLCLSLAGALGEQTAPLPAASSAAPPAGLAGLAPCACALGLGVLRGLPGWALMPGLRRFHRR